MFDSRLGELIIFIFSCNNTKFSVEFDHSTRNVPKIEISPKNFAICGIHRENIKKDLFES